MTFFWWQFFCYTSPFCPLALRHCVSAGEPLNPDVIEKWSEKTGLVIREGYGQTEMVIINFTKYTVGLRAMHAGILQTTPIFGFRL